MSFTDYLNPKKVANEFRERLMYELFPFILRKNKKALYLNLGYLDSTINLSLSNKDEKNRLFINLYHKLSEALELKSSVILEVGSGMGGGAYYHSEYHNVKEYLGIDLSRLNVYYSNKKLRSSKIRFKVGNAHTIPYQNKKFDFIFNLESSHRYREIDRFYLETDRVLKPSGIFAYGDIGTDNFF